MLPSWRYEKGQNQYGNEKEKDERKESRVLGLFCFTVLTYFMSLKHLVIKIFRKVLTIDVSSDNPFANEIEVTFPPAMTRLAIPLTGS